MKKALFLACLAISVGCREEDAPPVQDGGVAADGGTALDCAGVLACAAECPDDACAEACVERATPEAIPGLTALVECVQREACGEDSECIQTRCGTELGACFGTIDVDAGVPLDGSIVVTRDGGTADAGSSPLPARIEGTTRDWTTFPGTTDMLDSNATVVFVRDDAAGAAAGFPTDTHAFYRVQHITYRTTFAGADFCTRSADETETFTDPPAFENHLILERTAGADGLRGYELGTTLSVHHPDGMLVVCPPPAGTSTGIFNAEHNVSTGTSHPRGDGRSFVGSTTLSARNWSWDLHAVD